MLIEGVNQRHFASSDARRDNQREDKQEKGTDIKKASQVKKQIVHTRDNTIHLVNIEV